MRDELDVPSGAPETPEEVAETRTTGPFHVDLPQYIEREAHRPPARPLKPPPDVGPDPATGLRGLLKRVATNWHVKGTVQKLLGVLPAGEYLHYQLQRRVGGLKNFDHECDVKVEDWRLMMGHLDNARIDLSQARLMEMGTGWYPTFPICLYLAGAQHVKTVDVARLLKPELMLRMVERLAVHVPSIAQTARLDEAVVRDRHTKLVAALRRGETVTAATSGTIDYRAPSDAARTGLASASLDVVFSNSVLEHVPAAVIAACFTESFRILRPGGIIFHSVNCGDHYAYTDRRITQLNYLRYSDAEWAKWNNAFLYQNRLRARDFTQLAIEAGFTIELDTSRPHPKRLEQLARIVVHPQFTHYPREQLAITSIDFIGRKQADGSGN